MVAGTIPCKKCENEVQLHTHFKYIYDNSLRLMLNVTSTVRTCSERSSHWGQNGFQLLEISHLHGSNDHYTHQTGVLVSRVSIPLGCRAQITSIAELRMILRQCCNFKPLPYP